MRSTKEHGKPRMSKDLAGSRGGSRRTSQESQGMNGSMRISHDFHGGRHKGHGHGNHERKKGPQQELEDRLREEVAIRKKEHQLHEEMLAQAEEEQQKFETLHKQMRGKDYGYDCKGQVQLLAMIYDGVSCLMCVAATCLQSTFPVCTGNATLSLAIADDHKLLSSLMRAMLQLCVNTGQYTLTLPVS